MPEMTIPVATLKTLNQVTRKDDRWPNLQCVGLRDGRLVAADGYLLLTVDAPGDLPENTLVDVKTLLHAAPRGKKRAPGTATISVRDDGTQEWQFQSDGRRLEPISIVNYDTDEAPPDWKATFEKLRVPEKESCSITISAELLKRLAEAQLQQKEANSPAIRFTFPTNGSYAIGIEFNGDGGTHFSGFLMAMADGGRPESK